jgi:hypothetical protein
MIQETEKRPPLSREAVVSWSDFAPKSFAEFKELERRLKEELTALEQQPVIDRPGNDPILARREAIVLDRFVWESCRDSFRQPSSFSQLPLVISWSRFIPRDTAERDELKRFLQRRIDAAGFQKVIAEPEDDPKKVFNETNQLFEFTSHLIAMRDPRVGLGDNCVTHTAKTLAAEITGQAQKLNGSEPDITDSSVLGKEIADWSKSWLLINAARNARQPDRLPGKSNWKPEGRQEIKEEMVRLTHTVISSSLLPIGSSDVSQAKFDFLITSAQVAAQNPTQKMALAKVWERETVLREVSLSTWPRIERLRRKGYQCLVTARWQNDEGHRDMVIRLDRRSQGVETACLGWVSLKKLTAGMRRRLFPATLIAPFGIARPDEEEIRLRRELLGPDLL